MWLLLFDFSDMVTGNYTLLRVLRKKLLLRGHSYLYASLLSSLKLTPFGRVNNGFGVVMMIADPAVAADATPTGDGESTMQCEQPVMCRAVLCFAISASPFNYVLMNVLLPLGKLLCRRVEVCG